MRKSVKKLWTEALRSGEYVQGKTMLSKSDGRYCCLGVLCEIYIKQMKKNRKKSKLTKVVNTNDVVHYKSQNGSCYTCLLPEEVEKWAGLTREQVSWATTMNDTCGLNFSAIAHCIDCTY